jgi:hypothetical protein
MQRDVCVSGILYEDAKKIGRLLILIDKWRIELPQSIKYRRDSFQCKQMHFMELS